MMMNTKLTLSFTDSDSNKGKGDIAHNLRTRKGNGIKQTGVPERRDWNFYYVNPKYGKRGDSPDDIVKRYVYEKVKDDLAAYNAKILKTKNPQRVLSFDEWYARRLVKNDGTGKSKKPYEEDVLTYGDMFDTAPYVYETNDEGLPVDEQGNSFELWDSNHKLVPVRDDNGKPVKSEAYYILCDLYKMAVLRFNETCPNLEIISYAIHADEYGAIHIHWNYVPLVKNPNAKRGIGWTIAKTTALENECHRLNIPYDTKVKRKTKPEEIGNATSEWRKYMRNIFKELMEEHGLQFVEGGCKGAKHESVKEFKRNNARRAEGVRKQKEDNDKKELMLKQAQATLRKEQQEVLKQKKRNAAEASDIRKAAGEAALIVRNEKKNLIAEYDSLAKQKALHEQNVQKAMNDLEVQKNQWLAQKQQEMASIECEKRKAMETIRQAKEELEIEKQMAEKQFLQMQKEVRADADVRQQQLDFIEQSYKNIREMTEAETKRAEANEADARRNREQKAALDAANEKLKLWKKTMKYIMDNHPNMIPVIEDRNNIEIKYDIELGDVTIRRKVNFLDL